jgi:Ni/Fe-hydrogenase 1 B-type cytochrome subunit
MKEVTRKVYYLFSPWLRIFHWIMAACIVTLFATGLVITIPWIIFASEPTFSGMTVDNIRNIHFVAAYILSAAFIMRIYGFIVNPGDRLFSHVWKGYFYKNVVDVALHYMFLKHEHASYLRNPIARCSYTLLYVLAIIEVFTGFAMYYMTNPNGIGGVLFGWVITLVGGEYMAHLIHHYVAWAIMLFAIGHIYMVIRAEFMEGESEVSSMFAGSKILAHEPRDAGHLDGTLE